MKLTSVFIAIKYVLRTKKVWVKPQSASVVVYDREGYKDISEYINANEVEIFECRGESVNIIVLLLSFLKFGLKVNFERYAGQYIRMVNPVVVLTFIDNTITFYQVKKYVRDTKFISIQNGYRDNNLYNALCEVKREGEIFEADTIMCFGTAIGQLYSSHIESEVFSVGSFKNNKVYGAKKAKKTSDILFISQYRTPVLYEDKLVIPIGSKHILWEEFYSIEPLLLPCLQKFCKDNNFNLKVCGTSFNEKQSEEFYFNSILGDTDWEYIPKVSDLSSYENVDAAGVVVFIDSTLGYEALGRGAKAVAFPARGKVLDADDRGFGWPAKLPDSGEFWSNYFDASEAERLFKYITTVSEKDWGLISSQIIPQIMGYDQGNSLLVKILNDFGVVGSGSKK